MSDYLKELFIDEVKGCLNGRGGGSDGFSPSVVITDIDGGHRVTITDSTGEKSFDVLDGATGPKGDTGETGATGPAGADGKTPVKGTDYWTEADKKEIIDEVVAEINTTA